MRKHVNWLRVAGLLAAIGLIVGLGACGGSSGIDRSDAESTAQAWVNAVNDRDEDALVDLLCVDDRKEYEASGEGFHFEEVEVELLEVSEQGGEATIRTRFVTGGAEDDSTGHDTFRREGGEWCGSV